MERVIILIILFSLSACSFLNPKTVSVVISSRPSDAKIYIDDVYYGDTAKEIDLVPSKNYKLKIVKDNYRVAALDMDTKFSFRRGRQQEFLRCQLDFLTSILIIPFFGLKSVHCRDFVSTVYIAELKPIEQAQQEEPNNMRQNKSSNSNAVSGYYTPFDQLNPQSVDQNFSQILSDKDKKISDDPNFAYTQIMKSQPALSGAFNSGSEFKNNVNENITNFDKPNSVNESGDLNKGRS